MHKNELNHYGVKGMKWGVRRAQKRVARADKNIRRLETIRSNNKNVYDTMRAESREKYTGKKAKKLSRALAYDKAVYDTAEVNNKYAIARQKAKKDKSYKKSSEYQKAKREWGKQAAQMYVYGTWGHNRIETLKNDGYSERKAKGRTVAEQALMMIGTTAAVGTYAYLQSR